MHKRSEQELVRFSKLKELRSKGFVYPNDLPKLTSSTTLASAILEDPEKATRFNLAGRLVQVRLMGKAAFAHILDEAGKQQLYIRQDSIGPENFELFKQLDIGDIVQASGYLFLTKTGERTLHCETLRLLSKALIPLPEKWHGLSDTEARYRYRYVDLIANPEVREIFKIRARIIREIRAFLDARGYVEAETPVLHYIPGGATAKPFRTHHNALSTDMFLRIALELPLKKLVVGGLERVYEIGRVFRNEGLSTKHNPEFTMLEFYQAYATYKDLMSLTEELFVTLAHSIHGGLKIPYGERVIDLTPPWPRYSMVDSVYEIGGVERSVDLETLAGVKAVAKRFKIELEDPDDWGRGLEALWGELVEPKILNPVFMTNYPYSISPLARKTPQDPKVTDRFELIIAGMEIANAFSELNDPEDQRERFEAQADRYAKGDEEVSEVDEDFLRALEYGLPPTGGEGIGIDRLVMLLTNSVSIREVLLFPQLKPLEEE